MKPEFPEPLSHIWLVFIDLIDQRQRGDYSLGPILYGEIKAYLELTDQILSPKDMQVLKRLDHTYLRVMNG